MNVLSIAELNYLKKLPSCMKSVRACQRTIALWLAERAFRDRKMLLTRLSDEDGDCHIEVLPGQEEKPHVEIETLRAACRQLRVYYDATFSYYMADRRKIHYGKKALAKSWFYECRDIKFEQKPDPKRKGRFELVKAGGTGKLLGWYLTKEGIEAARAVFADALDAPGVGAQIRRQIQKNTTIRSKP